MPHVGWHVLAILLEHLAITTGESASRHVGEGAGMVASATDVVIHYKCFLTQPLLLSPLQVHLPSHVPLLLRANGLCSC